MSKKFELVQSLPLRPVRGLGRQNASCSMPQWCFGHFSYCTYQCCARTCMHGRWRTTTVRRRACPRARSSRFVASFFFIICGWSSCSCKYSTFLKFYTFLPVIANCPFHTGWFYFVLSCGHGRMSGLESQSFLPTQRWALSALWGYSLFQGHEIISSIFSCIIFYQFAVTWHHYQLQCSFFSIPERKHFRFVLKNNLKKKKGCFFLFI